MTFLSLGVKGGIVFNMELGPNVTNQCNFFLL